MPRSRVPGPTVLGLALALVGLAAAAVAVAAPQADRRAPGVKNPMAGLPDLVGPIQATPGCLGVETARTSSGKNVIFAWFEDKTALLRWYHSDVHRGAMQAFFGEGPKANPMPEVPADMGPILAIASTKMSIDEATGRPRFDEFAIELYTPITEGVAVGGRFGPKDLPVYDPNGRKAGRKAPKAPATRPAR